MSKRLLDITLIWLLALGVTFCIALVSRQVELRIGDVVSAFFQQHGADRDDIVVLGISEKTLAGLPYRSPFARDYLADVLSQLLERNPLAIGVDIIFDQPTTAEADRKLKDVLGAARVPVVIATASRNSGMSSRQWEFQSTYLAGLKTGVSTLLTEGGVIRRAHYGTLEEPSFARALYESVTGSDAALPIEVALHYPPLNESGNPPIVDFPLHLAGSLPDQWLRGRILLIGGMLPFDDRHRTPYSVRSDSLSTIPGVMLHALTLAQLLDGVSERSNELWRSHLATAFLAASGVLFGLTGWAVWTRLMGLVLISFGYWLALAWAHFHFSVLLLPLSPVIALAVSSGLASFYFGRQERFNRRFIENAFGHYVSPQIVESLARSDGPPRLGGERRDMTFLFTDLESFTSLSERTEPEELVVLLQSYLGGLVEIAFEHDGTIDKFVGDAVHVMFGAPADQPDHAQRAVRCAVAMDDFTERFRNDLREKGVQIGATRIGLHSGLAVVGNVGGERLFSYTAHGDVVNTAARLESANKMFGTRICASATVVEADPTWAVRPVGNILLRGKREAISVYSPVKGLSASLIDEYALAYEALLRTTGGDPDIAIEATTLFRELADRYPEDGLSRFHLRRLENGETGSTINLREG